MNPFNIKKTFEDKISRGWEKVYICIDLHDVVIEGKYKRHNEGADFGPNAVRVLQQLSYRPDVVLILWSSSHDDAVAGMLEKMKLHNIEFRYVNENPECPNTHLCDFAKKFYFNILLDDKAGFEIDRDWYLVEAAFKKAGAWDRPI